MPLPMPLRLPPRQAPAPRLRRPLRSGGIRRGAGARRAAADGASRVLRGHGRARRRVGGTCAARSGRLRSTGPTPSRSTAGWSAGAAWLGRRRRRKASRRTGSCSAPPSAPSPWATGKAGLRPLAAALGRGRLRRCRIRPPGRKLCPPSHGRDRRMARRRFCRHCQDLSPGALTPKRAHPASSTGTATCSCSGGRRASPTGARWPAHWRCHRGWTRQPGGRAHEAPAHHPARPLRHLRLQAGGRARRMGRVRRLRVRGRGRGDAARQVARRLAQRLPRHRYARLVDAGAGGRGERGRPCGGRRAAGAASRRAFRRARSGSGPRRGGGGDRLRGVAVQGRQGHA